MKKVVIFTLLFLVLSCEKTSDASPKNNGNEGSEVLITESSLKINADKNTIKERFPAPEGYEYSRVRQNSFAEYLQNFHLKSTVPQF